MGVTSRGGRNLDMNIGMIGCGIIGSRMVRNWQKVGHGVTGWNRTPSNAKDAGFPLLESPAAVAEASDVIMVVVADPPALIAVTEGARGLARVSLKGKVALAARLEPLLLQIGQKCFHFGAVGTAADAKLVMNMMLAKLMNLSNDWILSHGDSPSSNAWGVQSTGTA
jgi:3-hydroxyisobutyrate dehydrogenase-like beta-hydroxyacid dehydrogenase